MRKVVVVPYDEAWHQEFIKIESDLRSVLAGYILGIEHVGSTSVAGLPAKPILDIDVIIPDYSVFEAVKRQLHIIGYQHEGDLGIKDRHAFKCCDKPHRMKHHLYVCPSYAQELRQHLAFRDYLRNHPEDRDWYGSVKTLAAKHFPEDIASYMIAKKPCILEILHRATSSPQPE